MNRTNRCYFSFSSRRTAVWGAHAYSVLVSAFCGDELPNCSLGCLASIKEKFVGQNAFASTLQACAPRNTVDGSSLFIK